MKRLTTILLLLLAPIMIFAKVPAWQIVPEKSSLTFTAIQNNAPVIGKFLIFTGDILFDPENLSESKVTIHVSMKSVFADYEDLVETLKSAEWFDVEKFTQAIFVSNSFKKVSEKEYTAEGMLTLRDNTEPVTLTFTLKEFTDKSAQVVGKTTLKRLVFGVGQGEWTNTDEVKDDVVVEFKVSAVSAPLSSLKKEPSGE